MSTNKGKEVLNDDKVLLPTIPYKFPLEPLLFHLRDYELHFTYLRGPRYNEYAIFIEFQEWQSYGDTPFYQYLKILKTYRALLEEINQHPVLMIMPTGYISSHRWYHQYFEYWTAYEPYLFQFVTKVIPDIHICPFDQRNAHVLIPLRHLPRFDPSCLIRSPQDLRCKLLSDYSQFSPTTPSTLVTPFTSASWTAAIEDNDDPDDVSETIIWMTFNDN